MIYMRKKFTWGRNDGQRPPLMTVHLNFVERTLCLEPEKVGSILWMDRDISKYLG